MLKLILALGRAFSVAAAMKEIASAKAALATASSDDVDAVHLAFGDVSKSVEAMLTEILAVAAKYTMYECPMASDFKRWAQPIAGKDVAMANPYMGDKLLTCGSGVDDRRAGAMKHGDIKHGDIKHGDTKHGDK